MTDEKLAEIQEKADRIAHLMDDAIRVPLTNIRFGWDGILGIIPGIGDTLTMASQLYLISQARRVGIRRRVYAKMLVIALIDFLIGAIPVVGDFFDIFWKSNRKNVELLKGEIARRTGRLVD